MQPSLDDKLGALGQISQKKLLEILTKIPGKKDLIIDSSLIKPLDRIVGVSKLKAHNVEKIVKLDGGNFSLSNTQRVYFVKADLITVKRLSDKINSEIIQKNDGNSYHIILVGRKLQSIVNMLENEGTLGYVSLFVFQWELIKLDKHFLSMELHQLYRSLFVEGDQSCLPILARSIWTLCIILGRPLATVVYGKFSHIIEKMLSKMFEDFGRPSRKDSDISCMIIVDRDMDYASTLITGCTYSSLLDEVFGIKSGTVELKNNKSDTPGGQYSLNSSDEVYSQIKGRHFSGVFPYLSAKTKELSQTKSKSQNMAIAEMKNFISKELSAVTNFKKKLNFHISACESIINTLGARYEGLLNAEQNILECRSRRETLTYIEDCLTMDICDKYAILRLICLMSLAQDGLYPDELHRLKIQFFHKFGYQYLSVFHALANAGLCVEQSARLSKMVQAVPLPSRRSAFTNFAQKLKLLPQASDDYELSNPTDPSYVFGKMYIPAFCQIVNLLCKKEIAIDDLPKLLTNCTVKKAEGDPKKLQTLFIYIVGGVTYAEISAFELLEKLTGLTIVVASSSTINGNSIMKAFWQS